MKPESESHSSQPPHPHSSDSPATRWSQIVIARGTGPKAEEAWKILVGQYRRLIQRQIEHYIKDDPENLTSEFITRVFVPKLIPRADRAKGRFRSLLLTALRWFIFSELRRCYGSDGKEIKPPIPLADVDLEAEPLQASTEDEFGQRVDREFAAETFRRVFEETRADFLEEGGTNEEFELLIGNKAGTPVKEIAGILGISENAVKVRRHRLLKKFRDAFRQAVADLVEPEEVEEEIEYLGRLMELPFQPGEANL